MGEEEINIISDRRGVNPLDKVNAITSVETIRGIGYMIKED